MSGTDHHQTSGAPGSRDTGSDKPSGGPVERPSGAFEGDESVPSYGAEGEGPYGVTGEIPPQDVEPAVPPYEGRQTSATATEDASGSERGGARVGGATGPVEESR